VPFTKGFATRGQLLEHFYHHGAEFGALTPEEYQALADTFLGGPLPPGVQECHRKRNGDVIRFDPNTQAFGVLSKTGFIRTYFKPVPCLLGHGYRTNLMYWQEECKK
jgi:filamentous hemagglutinin